MDEARAVLARLERIEVLDREGAGAPALLAELRELVREATVWAERERDPRALEATAALENGLTPPSRVTVTLAVRGMGPSE